MKKIIIYASVFFLALLLRPVDLFAHRVVPKGNLKHVVVHRPIPPKMVLHSSTVVRSGYVWVNGYYTWNKRTQTYDWVRGKYIKQKRGKVWVSGQWVKVRGGWAYQKGSWQRVKRF